MSEMPKQTYSANASNFYTLQNKTVSLSEWILNNNYQKSKLMFESLYSPEWQAGSEEKEQLKYVI